MHGHRYDRYVKIVFCLQLRLVDVWWAMLGRYVLAVSLDMQAAAVCYHFSIGGGSYVGCQGGRGSHDRERIVNQADSLSVQGFSEEHQHNREGADSNRYFRSTAGVVSDIENIAADELSS